MAKAVLALFAGVLLTACSGSRSAAPAQEDLEAAREAAQNLGAALKARLTGELSSGGAVAAVDACALEAPEIAARVSDVAGYEVSRTALRVRNPQNAPDDWEREQLESFVSAARDGADLRSLESATLTHIDGDEVFRWMRPIVLDGVCVACHGEAIAPELSTRILALYPQDAATGFKEGEVRGAFSVTRRVHSARNDRAKEGRHQ